MREAIKLFGALSDETRLRLLFALRHGELCVCRLIELTKLSPSTVSKHLSLLRDAGLVDSRKDGRWVYYRLTDHPRLPIVGSLAAPVFRALDKSPAVRADDKRLKKICDESMESLCKRLFRDQRNTANPKE